MFNKFIFILMFLFVLNGYANEKVSLQLLWKHQFEFAGFYMAKEKGFYNKYNIDLDIKEYKLGQNIIKDVEQGKCTFGIASPNIIIEKSNGTKVVTLNALFQTSPLVFITLKTSGIKKLEDIKNKQITIENNLANNVQLLSMLYSKNISVKDMIKIDPSFNLNNFINKKIDISSAYLSNEIYTLNNKNIKYDIWNPKDYGFDFYSDILFTSSFLAKTNPRLVNNFQEASLRGWDYAFNNIEETVDIIFKKYNTQNKTKEALLYEAKILKKLAYVDNIPFGNISKNKIQRIYDIYNIMGFTKSKIDLENCIYKKIKKQIYFTIEEQNFINNTSYISVHNEKNWPPYNYNENNVAKGYSIDYMNLISSKIGIKINYISGYTWSEYLSMIKNNKIDVILNIKKTKKREEYINFTSEYIKASKTIFTNNRYIASLEDLENKIVSVPQDFFMHKFIKKNYPKIKLNVRKNMLDCIIDVIENKSDAVVGDFRVIQYLLMKKGLHLEYISIIKDPSIKGSMYIGVAKNKVILRDIIEKAKNNITKEELSKLKKKWFKKAKVQKHNIHFTKKEKIYLQKKKSINMCIDPNWMPFEKLENNKHIGISSDYFKLFKDSLGLNIKVIKTSTWAETLEFAKQRRCDIISLAAPTKTREEYLNFTDSYLNIPLVIATKLDITYVDDISGLVGKSIAIPKGYAFVEILKQKYPNLHIVEVKNIQDGLNRVNSGKFFGYIGSLITIGYQIQNNYLGELKIAGKFKDNWNLAVGVRNDDLILLSLFNKAINNISTVQKQHILNNWISIKYDKGQDFSFLIKLFIIFGVIALFFIYRQYLLHKTNNMLEMRVHNQTKQLQSINENLEERIAQEVEKSKKIEHQLYETEKLAAMSEMIGNIAHQWRQPLSIISSSSTGILTRKKYGALTDKKLEKSMRDINDSAQFLSKTITDFSSMLKGDVSIESFNLTHNLKKCFSIENSMLEMYDIRLIENYNDNIVLQSYPNSLIQCMINIINNAKDVLIEKEISNSLIIVTTCIEDENAVITIQDNAGGIPKDVIGHIFEAYFTTKHKSQGTGLGLNMTYTMITNEMKGSIVAINNEFEYENESYMGALFTIKIPLLYKEEEEETNA